MDTYKFIGDFRTSFILNVILPLPPAVIREVITYSRFVSSKYRPSSSDSSSPRAIPREDFSAALPVVSRTPSYIIRLFDDHVGCHLNVYSRLWNDTNPHVCHFFQGVPFSDGIRRPSSVIISNRPCVFCADG